VIPVPWIIAGVTALVGAGGAAWAVSASYAAEEEDDSPADKVQSMPVMTAEELAIYTVQELARSSPQCGVLARQWLELLLQHQAKEREGKGGFLGISRSERLRKLGKIAREVATCAGDRDLRRFGWERIGSFVESLGAAAADAAKLATAIA